MRRERESRDGGRDGESNGRSRRERRRRREVNGGERQTVRERERDEWGYVEMEGQEGTREEETGGRSMEREGRWGEEGMEGERKEEGVETGGSRVASRGRSQASALSQTSALSWCNYSEWKLQRSYSR